MIQNNQKFRTGKVFISATNPSDAINKIKDLITREVGGYICVSNMRMVRYAGTDKGYEQLMHGSLMNLPDGMPLIWLGKLWAVEGIACTNGPALFKTMLSAGKNECKHYLLGDTEDVIRDILKLNDEQFHADVVGAEALPFCKIEEFDYENISQKIKKSGANIVWTAMRAPKQDEFNRVLCKHMGSVVTIGVGRAFRLLTGSVQSAPKWAQKMGIAGLFTRKVSLRKALLWYMETFFFFISYSLQIVIRKMKGMKSYD